ncbi:hypothetical protein [Freshwater macrophyte associated alphaflexi-like virus 1]|nr:hypothetical protein [Freshwater macrophyte associated alphaflexi-like virus 1]
MSTSNAPVEVSQSLKVTARIRALEQAILDLQEQLFHVDEQFDTPERAPDKTLTFNAHFSVTQSGNTKTYRVVCTAEHSFDHLFVEWVRGKRMDALACQFNADGEALSISVPKRQIIHPHLIAEMLTTAGNYMKFNTVMISKIGV